MYLSSFRICVFFLFFILFFNIKGNNNSKEEIKKHIWLKTNDLENNLTTISKSQFGGVVINSYASIKQLQNLDPKIIKVFELNYNFNPFNEDFELPNSFTLSLLTDYKALTDYLSFFRYMCHNKGIDIIILPTLTKENNSQFNKLFHFCKSFDTSFFYSKDDFEFQVPKNKKQFIKFLDSKYAIILELDEYENFDTDILEKVASDFKPKYTIQPIPENYNFKDKIILNKQPYNLLASKNKIVHKVFSKSVFGYHHNQNSILPLFIDTIALWCDNNDIMKYEFEKYFSTVLNIKKIEKINNNIPIIVDARKFPTDAYNTIKKKYINNPILWICNNDDLDETVDDKLDNLYNVIVLPQNNNHFDYIVPQIIRGVKNLEGYNINSIPKPLKRNYEQRYIPKRKIMGYDLPQNLGFNVEILDSIDIISKQLIEEKAAPAIQILVAKEGSIVYNKSFGNTTFDSNIKINNQTLFDIASVTKVTATLPIVMKLVEEKKLHLDSTISYYLEEYKNTNKKNITIRSLLLHESGLKSYIRFWNKDFVNKDWAMSNEINGLKKMNLCHAIQDSIFHTILNSDLANNTDTSRSYVYSDLGFILLQRIVEKITNQSMEKYLEANFYSKLKLKSMVFNPLEKNFNIENIVPTEYDNLLRKKLVWGTVNDRNAFVMGGVSGHAGLFVNAYDLSIFLQMMLQNGIYDKEKYLDEETVHLFNHKCSEHNRRGLGWDKFSAELNYCSDYVSENSFGHTGFTGTVIWIDPDYELIFIFLSNRVYPTRENEKLIKSNARKRIHNLVYKSFIYNFSN